MTKDNEDALRCAEWIDRMCFFENDKQSAAHLRRLVQENEAKETLLRQALTAFRAAYGSQSTIPMLDAAISAIRQHLDQKTT